jgi:4-hydroxy-4-methyl-2-oxoglutarate aldolase
LRRPSDTDQAAPLSADELERIRQYDTCTVSNAIERFDVRLRNEGFANGNIHCRFRDFPSMLGYAVTARIRTSSPPMTGQCYYDRMDWWRYVTTIPGPRVLVLQDADPRPGIGAFVGEIHARIASALGCVGCITNGAVRDLAAVRDCGFHLFSGCLSVSHSYAHIIEFGNPVEIGGLKINPGDLLHGDRHGVHSIPLSIGARIPEAAAKLLAEEHELIDLCASPAFSLDALASTIEVRSKPARKQIRKTYASAR